MDGIIGATLFDEPLNNIEKQIRDDHNQFLSHYQDIISRESRHFVRLKQSTPQQDMEQGFDYVIKLDAVKIPVRNRNNSYLCFGDFTIRTRSRYGNRTEIDKIRDGFGDYYLYCWKNKKGDSIYKYMIIDLDAFRSSGLLRQDRKQFCNNDGTRFCAYQINELHKFNCLISLSRF